MSDSSLECAVSNLVIDTITLKDMSLSTNEDFDPDIVPDDIFENSQSYRGVIRVQSFSQGDGEDEISLYRYTYALGLRFVPSEQRELHEGGEISDEELEPYIEFKASFFADYYSNEELEKEAIDKFGDQHVGYHIWPYWREFLQNACGRLGIEVLSLPPYRVKKK